MEFLWPAVAPHCHHERERERERERASEREDEWDWWEGPSSERDGSSFVRSPGGVEPPCVERPLSR